MPIINATVTDVIQDGIHEFVAGYLKIDGVDATPGQYSVNGNTIIITLGDITTQKKITFETQIPENKVDEFFEQNGVAVTMDRCYFYDEMNCIKLKYLL